MAGRPRKPTAVKRLQGTLQKCRTPKAEPQPEHDLKTMLPPDYLTDSAKSIWEYSLAQVPAGMLTTLDFGIFSQWVVCYDQFVMLSAGIKHEGTLQNDEDGKLSVSGILHHLTKVVALLRGLENELGFTPASRSKVVSFTAGSGQKQNKFADL